ncbi:DNA recombination protein RmuC [Desulfofundulus australicus DSM 11792]|uniref:DNA recombination protein RmuC n=1 Tax=Desulfofundulus australicus DSM 11792 TaxID=1121425 RepID=A0A1M5B9F1_9FIRM|nr:DNA recombination protein RmuC [Desulfofundulus australicus]SHF39050.1 DNA recombination protein RmuC [Desulfofundulus australicus DSM 11792]
MAEVLFALAGLAAGVVAGWLLAGSRVRALSAEVVDARSRAAAAESISGELRQQVEQLQRELAVLRQQVAQEHQARVRAETSLEEARNNLAEQKKLLAEATARLGDTFKALSAEALKNNNQAFIELARQVLEGVVVEARGDLQKRQEAIDALIRPLKEELARYEAQVRAMENARQEAYGSLKRQLQELSQTQQLLHRETSNLVNALKTPQVRGRWGEITLRRVVEVAGMSPYCDFVEQFSVETEGGRLRPDLVVKLPGGRTVVVDAKVPLKAYMEAVEAGDEHAWRLAMQKHAQAVRAHMQSLGSRAYWSQFSSSPDFVVLFLPGESFFSAAVEQDRHLIEDALASRVLLATPTTLIALLRTVALSWQQHQMAENARQIAEAGMELYERVCKFAQHLAKIKDGLQKATQSFNNAVGSWESRLVPGARRLKELGAAMPGKELYPVTPVEIALRELPPEQEQGAGEW